MHDDASDISLANRLFETLGEEIISGILPPGAKLSEPVLSRRFGVSRSPVREALRRLEERNLITSAPNLGARVASFSPAQLLEVFHVREAMEGMACRLAAERMTTEEIDALEKILAAHERDLSARHDGAYYQDTYELDFHYRIARGSRNFLLEKMLCEEFYMLIRLFRRHHHWVSSRGRKAWEEHSLILIALRRRDAELAEILMRRHVAAARQNFEAGLRRGADPVPGAEASRTPSLENTHHANLDDPAQAD
ncbi:MAG: GntR family transcriptional regulator [Rhodospirillaceae bacterium]